MDPQRALTRTCEPWAPAPPFAGSVGFRGPDSIALFVRTRLCLNKRIRKNHAEFRPNTPACPFPFIEPALAHSVSFPSPSPGDPSWGVLKEEGRGLQGPGGSAQAHPGCSGRLTPGAQSQGKGAPGGPSTERPAPKGRRRNLSVWKQKCVCGRACACVCGCLLTNKTTLREPPLPRPRSDHPRGVGQKAPRFCSKRRRRPPTPKWRPVSEPAGPDPAGSRQPALGPRRRRGAGAAAAPQDRKSVV